MAATWQLWRPPSIAWPVRWQRRRAFHTYNPIGTAQRNVAHHYDLSDPLYDLFLDKDRQYSCAYFASDNDNLETAQANKKLHLAAKLLLEPGRRCSTSAAAGAAWRSISAGESGVDVTGVTLSHRAAQARAATRRGGRLADRVASTCATIARRPARFDRIVSVGMFEHVGVTHYREFFRKVKELLSRRRRHAAAFHRPHGRPGATNPWLRKYIFPGGYTPALSEVLPAVEEVGLWVTDIEILRLHYA